MRAMAAALGATLLMAGAAQACTVALVTAGAAADGSVMVAHSNDGFGGDPNLIFVPARDHAPGSMRPVYPSAAALGPLPGHNCAEQPYLVAPERGADLSFPGREPTRPLGYIPEVAHTYAYLDGDYPMANEQGLLVAECTDLAARLPEAPYREGGGIFYSAELARVALERCAKAREAVGLMGGLIERHGLWGTAETLLVADHQEAWIMEMSPAPSGEGGLWVAERIPDGHFLAAANQLRIRAIREGDPTQLHSKDLPLRLVSLGWAVTDAEGRVDWALSLDAREYQHPYYSKRRVWRALSLMAPSLGLSPSAAGPVADGYPLSVRPDHPIGVTEVMALLRDHYAGTPYDKAQGPLAGLFGSPYHYEREMGERAISTAKSSHAFVAQSGPGLPAPVVWFATNNPGDNPFVPFAVDRVPPAYQALRDTYDEGKMYWAASRVMALAQGFYSVIHPKVEAAIAEVEGQGLAKVARAASLGAGDFAAALRENAQEALSRWQALFPSLLLTLDCGAGVTYKAHPDPLTPSAYAGQ
ncbi:MAG: C69 family dipeptidase [Succinivibrionaceae bacterium]|nr:C69 family dipeptidase [Succinivibrionaceae bacterium]